MAQDSPSTTEVAIERRIKGFLMNPPPSQHRARIKGFLMNPPPSQHRARSRHWVVSREQQRGACRSLVPQRRR
jgi:hypothetical protein